MIWAIVSKAPLEQPANPGYAPNPAKAPWYFLGLQEMLVYFDPWMAGVVYPGLIIVGPVRDAVHRHQPKRQRLLHRPRAAVRARDLAVRLPDPLGAC